MIIIEVCYVEGLSDQNFNMVKAIKKLRRAAALPGTDTWLRINPNYVKSLEAANIITKNPINKNFVQLTWFGVDTLIFDDSICLSLEEYFVHEPDIPGFIEDSLFIAITNASYKIMHNICHSCGIVKRSLNHIVDEKKNDGMYCNQCLNTIGYAKALERANTRRKEAQYAFSIRPD